MTSLFNKQRGAILVVSLVVLTTITLISVTELSKAGEQSRMTSNFQQQTLTFNLAESAMSHSMKMISEQAASTEENMVAMGNAMTADEGVEMTVNNTQLSTEKMKVAVSYKTETVNSLRAGISLDSSQNDFMIRKVNFTATSTATDQSSGATSTIVQGFTYE
ncbi:MAG: pilus assembly PilX family protein [Psychrobium sp.]